MQVKRYFLSLFVALVFSFCFPSEARADGWLEFFFPSLKKEEAQPTETGMAPFAQGDDVITAPTVEEGLPENSTPLHIRHRPSADIANWVETVLPDLMSYQTADYKTTYKAKALYFNDTAKTEYLKFLRDGNYIKTLETGRYDINAFVEEIPIIMNEGEVEGRYRWLYKTKMMVTYVARGATDYKTVKDEDTHTQSMYVTVQVGRMKSTDLPDLPQEKNPHGILIESFDVKLIKPKTE